MAFPAAVGEELLVRAARRCCLCREYKGTKIEVHHIVPAAVGGGDDFDNGIPLCFDCHADVESYNAQHPRGRKFRPSELRRLRDEWFAQVSSGITAAPQSSVERLRLMDERFQAVIRDYGWSGNPRRMIDTYSDLTTEEKAELYDRATLWKKGRPGRNNPYRN